MNTPGVVRSLDRAFGRESRETPGPVCSLSQGKPCSVLESGVLSLLSDRGASDADAGEILRPDRPIHLIHGQKFLAECLKILLRASLGATVEIHSSLESLRDKGPEIRSRMVLISIDNLKKADAFGLIRDASAVFPDAPVVVLSPSREPRLVREVMECGVEGCIPMAMGFAVAIEAVRFVLAGGTYVPPESIMAPGSALRLAEHKDLGSKVTRREMSIIQAIQQGKSNKIIAYDLKMCESTVKVHIRNIMKKLQAKNRTEVAVRSVEILAAPHLYETD